MLPPGRAARGHPGRLDGGDQGGLALRSDPPRPSDLIEVPAGGSRERMLTAVDLYKDGLAPAVMITSPEGFPGAEMKEQISRGIPECAPLRRFGPHARHGRMRWPFDRRFCAGGWTPYWWSPLSSTAAERARS